MQASGSERKVQAFAPLTENTARWGDSLVSSLLPITFCLMLPIFSYLKILQIYSGECRIQEIQEIVCRYCNICILQ